MSQRHVDAVTGAWAAAPGDARAAGASGDAGGGADPERLLINLGPGHPSGHGMLRLSLTLEADRIVAAEPVIGYVHRGAEKLFDELDCRWEDDRPATRLTEPAVSRKYLYLRCF